MTDKKIFISHSSKDKTTVEHLVQLLVNSGIPMSWIVCSSVAGTHIPVGENLLEFIKNSLSNEDIIVLFVLSDNFYKSPICLNEMGATWVKGIEYFSVLLKDFKRQDVDGCIDKNKINISLSEHDKLSIAGTWDLKRKLEQRLNISIDELQWQLGWDKLFSMAQGNRTQTTHEPSSSTKKNQWFRMTDVQGYCIGDDYHDGCKVIKRSSGEELTTVQLDFSKTSSGICSVVYPVRETDWTNIYNLPGASISFSAYYIADFHGELSAEIELHMNNGYNVRIPFSLIDDKRMFQVPFTSFSDSETMWKYINEVCFLFDRRNITAPVQIVIEHLSIG